MNLACLAAPGGDHDYTVGTAGTIHGVGGCILEDCDSLDVACGNGVETSLIRHAVDDEQRGCACEHGTETTDLDACA